jgi:hypothetical protein
VPPPGAVRLRVEQRESSPEFPGRPANADASKLNGLFDTASALLAFHPVTTLAATQAWRGELAGTGFVRLIAETATGLYVAGFDLR